MKIAFTAKPPSRPDALVVGVYADRILSASASEIDRLARGALGRAMSAGRFTGAREEFVDVVAPVGVKAKRVVLAGLGKKGAIDERRRARHRDGADASNPRQNPVNTDRARWSTM